MLVFKFGGASIRNAKSIRAIPGILKKFPGKMAIVISAIDKTTNKLEVLTDLYMNKSTKLSDYFEKIKQFHLQIAIELFNNNNEKVVFIEKILDQLETKLRVVPTNNYDYEYDQLVPFGEMLSTTIISVYLNEVGIPNKWLDIREIFVTSSKHRDATVDFKLSKEKINKQKEIFDYNLVITQGFIGATESGISTTLGREGSDYTGAVLAYLLEAESLTVWKDVEGIMNADPQWRNKTIRLEEVSYKEAIELAFFGAKVIHPKTIKPLQNKNIPLYVKSFLNPEMQGTIIGLSELITPLHPVFIRKQNQVLLSIIPRDFSFVAEDNLKQIFSILTDTNVKVNLMQNAAVSFSLCLDYEKAKFEKAIVQLNKDFNFRYNTNLELITIRHYDQYAINEVVEDRNILLEQRTRNTVQFVLD